jgi:hypothetical protein
MISPKQRKEKDAQAEQVKQLTQAATIANTGAQTMANVSAAAQTAKAAGLFGGPTVPPPPGTAPAGVSPGAAQ